MDQFFLFFNAPNIELLRVETFLLLFMKCQVFLKKTLSTRFDYINAELLIEFRKNWYRGDKIGF